MKSALQVSAGGVSLPRADRGEPAPRRTGSGVRAARHRRLRRAIATSTSSSSTPRPIRRTSAIRIDGASTAGPTPRRCTSCRTCGSATRGPGGRRRGPSRRSRAGRADGVCLVTDDSGTVRRSATCPLTTGSDRATCTDRRRRPLFTDNETNGERVYGPATPAASRTSRTRSTARSASASRRRSDPTAAAPRRRCTTSSRGAGAAARSRCACGSPTRRPADAARRRRRRSSPRARPRPTSSTQAVQPPEATADERLVQRQALAGLLWTQAELPLRRRRAGSTATTRD